MFFSRVGDTDTIRFKVAHAGKKQPLLGVTALTVYARRSTCAENSVDGVAADSWTDEGEILFTPETDHFDTVGRFFVYVKAVRNDGSVATFPDRGFATMTWGPNFE